MDEAIRVALDLLHLPSRTRMVREAPLPQDVVKLLQIAAGDGSVLEDAVNVTKRAPNEISEAAAFFIEQILLAPHSDAYRILGARSSSAASELRRNMAMLLQWLHPDKNNKSNRSVFAIRVTQAWESLKTPERRQAYDEAQQHRAPRHKKMHRSRRPPPFRPFEEREGMIISALRRIFRVSPR